MGITGAREASFYKSCAEKPQLLEHWSSSSKAAPSQTRSCPSLCCTEKSVFSLGFIIFRPLPGPSSACTHLPPGGLSCFCSLALFRAQQRCPRLALSSEDLLDPVSQGAEADPLPGLRDAPPSFDLFFHLEFRALFCFSPLQKGPEAVFLSHYQ